MWAIERVLGAVQAQDVILDIGEDPGGQAEVGLEVKILNVLPAEIVDLAEIKMAEGKQLVKGAMLAEARIVIARSEVIVSPEARSKG